MRYLVTCDKEEVSQLVTSSDSKLGDTVALI